MATNSFPPKLTFFERLDLIPANLSLVAAAVYAAIAGIFRGKSGARYYGKHIHYAVIRRMLWRLSIRQNQYLNPSTNQVYETFAKTKGFPAQTVQLDHGAQGHWIGNKDAKNVLIYYHGGGFAVSANLAYFHLLSDIMDELNADGKDVAVFFLTYTLTPHAVYPTQMRQSVEALRYILQKTDREPQNVIIGGDSAGGNLTLSTLAHLSHPHEAIQPLEVSSPLAGAFTIAPWVSFSQDFPSVKENQNKDMITSHSATIWSDAYLAGQKPDNYNQPLLAPAEWWKDAKANSVLILAGSDEILLSCINEFVEKFKAAVPNTTYIVGQDEPHVGPIISRMLGDFTEGQTTKGWKSWLSARL
ncbi:hypothetical protein FQN57_004412 [Myotisia sp. PD_48]|nr:hypothetical protein FQN57_004412 [Myotisia sp. PD_48]